MEKPFASTVDTALLTLRRRGSDAVYGSENGAIALGTHMHPIDIRMLAFTKLVRKFVNIYNRLLLVRPAQAKALIRVGRTSLRTHLNDEYGRSVRGVRKRGSQESIVYRRPDRVLGVSFEFISSGTNRCW